jgi:hypothetical protein
MLRMLGIVAYLAALALGSACASAPAAVHLEATPTDIQALVGEWQGEYSSAATGRSGSIVFKLIAGEDHAHGDVVMIPTGSHRPYVPIGPVTGTSAMRDLPEVLAIRFVRAAEGGVSGSLEPYRDPDCDCEANTTFTGRVRGDVVEGTFLTISRGMRGTPGHWKVQRKR